MTNFSINFWNPWLLLLLIPAFGLTLFSYFRLNKRYRFTRNRIVSMVLHLVIMVFSIAVLAGMTFSYYVKNTENEVILLVDASYSTSEDSEDDIDEFIQDVIDSSNESFKLGIVTFGYDQVLAVAPTSNSDGIYSRYVAAEKPDTTATDISAALKYAATLFNSPRSARIVLISDGIETDGNAASVIKSVAAQGIKVDTVYFPGEAVESEVQIVGLTTTEEKINVGTNFNFDLSIQSSFKGELIVTPYDNNVAGTPLTFRVKENENTLSIPYSFALPGMYEMRFEIESVDDTLDLNNNYVSYVYLEIYDDILVLESIHGESSQLTKMLGDEMNVTVVNTAEVDKIPTTLDALREYDEVILCNVSNGDLPTGFDKILYSYVHDIGGGLFAICGNKENSDSANAFTVEDMKDSTYLKELLPVEIVEYTPPAAVMVLVDISGSMVSGKYEDSKLYQAVQGAISSLDALTERDYYGVMTLSDTFDQVAPLTPVPQRDKILNEILDLEESIRVDYTGGGTVFSTALWRAGTELYANKDVQKRHIIIVTDGEPATDDADGELGYKSAMLSNAAKGITTTIVGIGCTGGAASSMKELLINYANGSAENFIPVDNATDLPSKMRAELAYGDIKEMNYSDFYPKINTITSVTAGVTQAEMPMLSGYYGVKLKPDAQAILMGEYSPIYSQWKFGQGTVGLFACDLNGTWSNEFVGSTAGAKIVSNIVSTLFPTEDVSVKEIEAEIVGDNYSQTLSVFTNLGEGEYVEVTVNGPENENGVSSSSKFNASASDGYSRIPFSITAPGLYEIVVEKKAADGTTVASTTIYKALSYSKEYDMFADSNAAAALTVNLAELGGGFVLGEPEEVFDNAVEYLYKVIDPKIPLIIAVIVMFLLDIAARKFKWKWIHEIIREKKEKSKSESK